MTISETRKEKLWLAQFTRSSDWPKVRRLFLRLNPKCAVCGATKKLTAHHIKPFYIYPELELEPSNLITLCESGANHHLMFGHLMSYKSYNEDVFTDAAIWSERIARRPKWDRMVQYCKS